MSVYVDQCRLPYGRMKMGHMIADTLEELHAMAEKLGVRRWFQDSPPASFPHYDLSLSKRAEAISLGAIDCDRRVFSTHYRRLRDARRGAYTVLDERQKTGEFADDSPQPQ